MNVHDKKFQFAQNKKRSISEFNKHEIYGFIITNFLQVEYKVDDIILVYTEPNNKEFFKKYILNTSILPFGNKLKLLMNIMRLNGMTEKSITDELKPIRKLNSIRNAFAHTNANLSISGSFDEENKKHEITEISEVLNVMNNNSKITGHKINVLAIEFVDLFHELIDNGIKTKP